LRTPGGIVAVLLTLALLALEVAFAVDYLPAVTR
jgi:hypothetical protein